MTWGTQTRWDSDNETIEQWLERERIAQEKISNPTCPYCGEICFDWWEWTGLNRKFEVANYEVDCRDCGKIFLVDKETRVQFTSKKPTPTEREGE